MASNEQLNSELESFREQWLSDLRTRNTAAGSGHTPSEPPSPERTKKQHGPPPSSTVGKKPAANVVDDDEDYIQGRSFDEPPAPTGHTLAGPSKPESKKLVSALDHFEEAMEREAQGNMGDSLTLYRKAYKLDNGVDRRYREKHFPAGHHKPAPPSAKPSQPATTTTPQDEKSQILPIAELLASFSSLSIEPTPPEVEGMPQPPCPIADLPDELIVHILQDVAIQDIADFVRLSLVCRRLAYLVASEQRIWRRISLGQEVGFAAMHYHFRVAVDWTSIDDEEEQLEDGSLLSMSELQTRRAAESALLTKAMVPADYASWKSLFRHRPRIRFNGCYISTVNYIRSGQASTNQATWGSNPIHIVTYYRYLRFFRDGSVISLLSTTEPAEVVHHLTRDFLHYHRSRDRSHTSTLPSAVMNQALKGRWRLSSALDHPDPKPPSELEGDLFIETEGVGPKYMYRMDLSLRSAGKGARNNKLVWGGFYIYNKLTDDWGEFSLKNDKPFFFSRVKSYGSGE